MKQIKRSIRTSPRVSLILIDWSVRESFHILHYLSGQDVERELFEVVVIEYYSKVSKAVSLFEGQVDSWILLEMPDDCYYHKHLMYNAGIVASNGDICVICDSDSMVKPSFIRSIISEMDSNSNSVIHLDQFRNERKDFYPFAYPDFLEVTGKGCINNFMGKTIGLADEMDTIHTRNYGACMCARRVDLIKIGGSDEHNDYLGHICGPYEMTFRLVNSGCREVWHQNEFTYHTWHPGQAGEANYLGPHDGRHVSTTALNSLITGKILPLNENSSIQKLRLEPKKICGIESFQIKESNFLNWKQENLKKENYWKYLAKELKTYRGFVIRKENDEFFSYPRFVEMQEFNKFAEKSKIYAKTEKELRQKIDNLVEIKFKVLYLIITLAAIFLKSMNVVASYLRRRWIRVIYKARI